MRVSRYGGSSSCSQFSLKFTTAALAWACTRGALKSSMTAIRPGSTAACCCSCSCGPRSVHICPMAWHAAHRTCGFWSCSPWMHMDTSESRCRSMALTQPSAIWARQMRAAWRCFQSESAISPGRHFAAKGISVLPPRLSASLSRHSCPNSYSSPSPSASCRSLSARCQSSSSSMSSRKDSMMRKMASAKVGSLRIIPGALSRASHSVTRNSAASWRVASSSASAPAICSIAATTSASWRRKNRGCASAISINISRASCAEVSSCAFRALPIPASISGVIAWNLSRSDCDSRHRMNEVVARIAARRTSADSCPSAACSTWCRVPMNCSRVGIMWPDSCANTSSAASVLRGSPLCTAWLRKGSSSGHPLVSIVTAASSLTVSQIFFVIERMGSFWMHPSSSRRTCAWCSSFSLGHSLGSSFVRTLRNRTAQKVRESACCDCVSTLTRPATQISGT
mmetsp:Transcript_12792/g.38563  ORF Transcript_12792/g.38563 Transcript_12792/m.38563 type:complete len:454 (+) Transcript_12792:1370-2731(+)